MARKKITDEQLQEELNAGMKNVDIARKYGISDRVIRIRKAKLAKKGVGHGRDVSHLVPDGYKIKGTSSLVDEFGNTKLQWVKTDTDAERQVELMKAVIEGMKSEITPVAPVKAVRAKRDDKLLNLYTVSDFHLGMLAWADESGDDWGMKIVESRNMIVEQHRTLAAKDAYASRGGWMSGRSANVITYSAEYGEVARLTISPEMLG